MNLRKLIRELVEEELSEVTTTGDVAGYQTPYAFAGKNKSKRKKSAEQSGYTLADGMGDEQSDSTEDNEPLIVRKKMGENKIVERSEAEADRYGFRCVRCKKGIYGETSIHDDLDGRIHCNKCGHEIMRHGPKVVSEAWEGYSLDRLKTMLKNYENELRQLNSTNLRDIPPFSPANRGQKTNQLQQAIVSLKQAISKKQKVTEAVTHYHEFKSDDTLTPRQKIGRSIRGINQQLSEIEKTVHMCSRLKTEIGVEGTELWKRTQRHLGKIEERINRVASKIRDIKA